MAGKSILIIDTPNDCDECPLQDGEKCYARQDWISTISNWRCPLKPLPELRDEHWHCDNWELERIKNAESRGFNWCIDEIMGEKE